MRKILLFAATILSVALFASCTGGGDTSGNISVNPGTINFTAAGGSDYVTVTGDDWTVTSNNPGWITAVKEGNSVKVTVGAATEARTGSVTVASSTDSKVVNVVQAAPSGGGDVIFDDFEGHTDFAINSPGTVGWSYIDVDGYKTYGVGEYDYANRELEMAAMIFNPSQVGPGLGDGDGMFFSPYGGNKYLAFFASASSAPVVNNDWFISPALSFGGASKIAFWAKGLTEQYGLERMRVAYSTGGNAAADFTNVLTAGSYVEVGTTWTRYEFDLPANAKYVGINCVSPDRYALCVDDVAIGTGTLPNMAPPAPAFAPEMSNGTPTHLYRARIK